MRACTLRERFEAKVDRSPGLGPHGECHLWTSPPRPAGYGQIKVDGIPRLAHRVAFFLAHGRWPSAHALHTCDTPACVNTEHLFEGTDADNTADKMAKNRQARGNFSSACKLNEQQVREIQADTRFQRDIAAAYGVAQSLVSGIKSGARWAHVA